MPIQNPTPLDDGMEVKFTLAFDTIVGERYGGGEDPRGGSVTLLDCIVMEAARRLVDHTANEIRQDIRHVTREIMRARVAELVEAELRRVWQPVDGNGVPTAQRTDLVKQIHEAARSCLEVPKGSNDAFGRRQDASSVAELVKSTTKEIIVKELSEAIQARKAELVGKVGESFSSLLAAEIVKAVSK